MESDIEDKFLRIKEENLSLKKQANEANNNIKLLTTRLNRLLEMSKRSLVNEKSKKLVSLEESIFNLQLKIGQLESENRKLRQRSLVLQTKLDASRRRQYRSMYSSVPSRTDSGLEWINDTNSTTSNQQYASCSPKPSSARLTVHHRSSSTISLNRVTFNSHRNSADATTGRISSGGNQFRNSLDGESLTRSLTTPGSKGGQSRQRTNSENNSHHHHHHYRESLIVDGGIDQKSNGSGGKHDFILQLLKETQEEIGRLQEIIILQQHYIDGLQADLNSGDHHGVKTTAGGGGLIIKTPNESVTENRSGQAIESTQITMEKLSSTELANESLAMGENEKINSDPMITDDYQKMLQVFKLSNCGEKFNLGSMTTNTKTVIPSEIIRHVEKLSNELIESQNVIKSLRAQLIKDNLAAIKIVEMNQKLDHLTQENEILQKSLQNCIGTCISGLEKEETTEDGTNDDKTSSGGGGGEGTSNGNTEYNSKRIKNLNDKVKRLMAENARYVQSLEEKNQLINLLQVKYNNLKDAYDLIISSSRSTINKSTNLSTDAISSSPPPTSSSSLSPSTGKSKYPNTNQQENNQLIGDKGSENRMQSTIKSNQESKDAILDSLGQVREMVNSVQNELENGLKLEH